jgi:saccharopine dehydrogenase-like NADP-dependent oxidoreductase
MENKEIHIGIVGAGKIGTAIYSLLVGEASGYKISIADITHPSSLSSSIAEHDYVQLNDADNGIAQFSVFAHDKTLIINALPFHLNIDLYYACYEHRIPYFDLSEDDALDESISNLTNTIPYTSYPFTMPHCGLAPGMSTVVANHLAKDFSDLHDVKIRVGALSQDATNKLKYHSSWSGDGLVNEYMGKCQVVRNGAYEEVDALDGYETLTIQGTDYEAFNTSGGIGSYAKSLSKQNIAGVNADYKTLRRVGHHQYVDFLFNDLKLPQDELTQIFKKYIPTTKRDEVIIYVTASGYYPSSINHVSSVYYKVFKPEIIRGRTYTAIEYTTACGVLAMVELYLNGKLPQTGYVTQESVDWKDVLSTTFGRFYKERNVYE